MKISNDIIKIIEKACDLDFDGILKITNSKGINEVSVFDTAQKTYNSNTGTCIINEEPYTVADVPRPTLRTGDSLYEVENTDSTTENNSVTSTAAQEYAAEMTGMVLGSSVVKENLTGLIRDFEEIAENCGIPVSILVAICLEKPFMSKKIAYTEEIVDNSITVAEAKTNITEVAESLKKALELSNGDMTKALNRYYHPEMFINRVSEDKINSNDPKTSQILALSKECEETIIPEVKKEIKIKEEKNSYADEYDLTKKEWAQKWWGTSGQNVKVKKNMDRFFPYFQKASAETGIPISILMAICSTESTMGVKSDNIMQFSKTTARAFGCKNIYDAESSIMAAARYLKHLLDISNGNMAKALVGYNTGEYSDAFKKFEKIFPGGYADKVLSLSMVYEEEYIKPKEITEISSEEIAQN